MIQEAGLLILFLVLSIVAALSEGIGVSMLVPILETQANSQLFSNIPFLSSVSDLFVGENETERLHNIAIVLGIILLLRGGVLFLVDLLGGVIPYKLERNMAARGYEALIKVEHSYFTEKNVGDHTNSLRDWVVRVTHILSSVATAIYNFILVIVYMVIMLFLSWKLALFAALFVVLITAVLKGFVSGPLHKLGQETSARDGKLSELFYETLAGMKFIKISSAQKVMVDRYKQALNNKIDMNMKMVLFRSITNPFLSTSAGLFICFLLYAGTYIGDGQQGWLSNLLLFMFLLLRLLAPVYQINTARVLIFGHAHSLEKLDEFFNETGARVQPSGTLPFTGIKKGISFENVSFRYQEDNDKALNGLSVEIPANKMVAIVGPSGSGKTTLVSLLARFYDPQEGSIKIDGVDLKNFDIQDLRRHTSIVSQDIFLFNDTVLNNLAFSLDNVSLEQVEHAVKLAHADEFIVNMPDGLETKLGDRGVRLSGGQQQRIAIARAFLRSPDLLILDEATSHLDTHTEQVIQDAVEVLRQQRTVLVIAHRLSTIRRADKVIVIKKGHVVEQGTHVELMERKGVYWDMVCHQSSNFVDEENGVLELV